MLHSKTIKLAAVVTTLFIAGFLFPHLAEAHCDTLNGPVAEAARDAMANDNVAEVLIWVSPEEEDELKSIYRHAMEAYRKGGTSKELAKRYFIENAVRLHRLAEGMTYKGLKPAQPLPVAVRTAEEALNTGNFDPVTGLLFCEIKKKASELFKQAVEAKKNKNNNIAAGRKWADAYVKYIIYIQGLYTNIQAAPAHGVGK